MCACWSEILLLVNLNDNKGIWFDFSEFVKYIHAVKSLQVLMKIYFKICNMYQWIYLFWLNFFFVSGSSRNYGNDNYGNGNYYWESFRFVVDFRHFYASPFIVCVLSVRTVLNVCYFMTPSFPLCFNYGFFFIMCIKHKMQCFSHVIFCSHKN